ncbi:DNA methyltransferase, partial [Pseudomonas carnis]
FYKSKLKLIEGQVVPAKPLTNLWSDIPYNGIAREGGVVFKNGKKPERLLKRCIELCTEPGDLVLDSFAGSGTTGAVAHKMGRRWIMVELGEHAKTHILPRLQKIIDGSDNGGVTDAENWQGGGGYRFFKLAPSLLQKDKWGNLIINKDYQPEMLAEAICKHFNYTYAPSAEHYWMHGKATENAFIYVTTNSLTFDQLKALSDEVGEERSLLVCCMAYEAAGDSLMNLTIKKIPRVVLDCCEWGKDDYSLKIAALPLQDEEPEEADAKQNKSTKIKASVTQTSLFDGSEEN